MGHTVTRIDALTKEQRAMMAPWADRWIAAGLRTGEPDRETFRRGVDGCYAAAGLPPPTRIVWVSSPLVLALAAPTAAYLIERIRAVNGAVNGAVGGAVNGAVGGAVGGAVNEAVGDAVSGAVRGAVSGAVGVAVDEAVDEAVRGAVREAVDEAVRGAVRGAVDGAVRGAVDGAVGGAVDGAVGWAVREAVDEAVHEAVGDAVDGAVGWAVRDAVHEAVGDAVGGAVRGAIRQFWGRIIGGQFWVGGWWYGVAYVSYFRHVCHLALPAALDRDAQAYEDTALSAAWWWPHRDFVIVCTRPSVIATELVDPARPRGWGSHRLHCATGPAIAWPDGWGVWAWHGVRVPRHVIEAPHTIAVEQIQAEKNAEVRRVMIERMGWDRWLSATGATPVQSDRFGDLYRTTIDEAEVGVVVVTNSTPEPDGSFKRYALLVPADHETAHSAVAGTFGLTAEQYQPAVET